MNTIDAKDIEYNGSNLFYTFKGQNKNGFGFSNFRQNNETNQVNQEVNQVNEYTGPKLIYDNPVSEFDYKRNSNFFFKDHYADYKSTGTNKNDNYYDIMKTFQELNPLIYSFFSKKNIDHLKNLLALFVKKIHNYTISPDSQSEQDIVATMRSVYISSKNNYPMAKGNDLINQVCKLNMDTLDKLVPIVSIGVQEYLCYARDKSTNPYTIDRAKSTSVAGLKNHRGFDYNII